MRWRGCRRRKSLGREDHARALLDEFAAIAEPVAPALMVAVWNSQAVALSCAAMGKRPAWRFACPCIVIC